MPVASVNGININYRVTGQGDPLVMIMGFISNQGSWRPQVSFFKKYFQVVTFDNRGVGKSDKPEGPYTIQMMVEDTITLMDHLGIKKAHIMGVSMGGMVAQELAINYPPRVKKLILGCTFACQDDSLNGQAPEWFKALDSLVQGKVRPIVSLVFNRRRNRIIFVPLMKLQSKMVSSAERQGILAQREACIKHHCMDRLPLITAPTLVIAGTGDRVVKPSSSDVMARLIPNAKLVKLENGSHAFFAEMAKPFNKEVLRFLQNDR